MNHSHAHPAHDHAHPAHDHAHAHAHPPAPIRAARRGKPAGASLLLLSGTARLAIASGFAAASWALIVWAMA